MKRIMIALALVGGPATATLAQPGLDAPGIPPVGALAPGNNVTVSNKCCSIWDFLGVQQFGSFVNNQICKTQLFTGMNTLLGPLGRALGLGPSLLSDKFAKEGGVMGLANKLKKEEKKVPLKVRAIRYLATLDCHCYPDIVTQLLLSLDDCSEKVRYEALKALHNKCGGGKCCGSKHMAKKPLGGCKDCGVCDTCTDGDCPPCDCPGCQCQKEVLARLNKLLLDRDEFGCLKEKSQRVRDLATQMIEECLVAHQPHPAEAPVQEEQEVPPTQPPPPLRDPGAPTSQLLPAPSKSVPTIGAQRSLPKYFGGEGNVIESKVIDSKIIDTKVIEGKPSAKKSSMKSPSTGKHVVGYRGSKSNVQEVMESEPIVIEATPEMMIESTPVEGKVAKPQKTWSKGQRRHLVGELFGY